MQVWSLRLWDDKEVNIKKLTLPSVELKTFKGENSCPKPSWIGQQSLWNKFVLVDHVNSLSNLEIILVVQ